MKGNHGKQPEAVARLKGTYKPYKYPNTLSDDGIVYLTTLPNPPDGLNDIGALFWNNILGGAININGYIAIHDIYQFELLCYTYQLMELAKKDIELFGTSIITESGKREKSFGYQMFKENARDFNMLCKNFGLDPSSRTVIKFKSHGDKKDSLDNLDL